MPMARDSEEARSDQLRFRPLQQDLEIRLRGRSKASTASGQSNQVCRGSDGDLLE